MTMAEHDIQKGAAPKMLNKALWMQALDELEREFRAYQQRSLSLAGAVSGGAKSNQQSARDRRQLILDLED
jgi:hypothetical protein